MAAVQPHFAALLLQKPAVPLLDFFLFAATLAYYNFDRWVDLWFEKAQNERQNWLKAHTGEWLAFTLAPGILAAFIFILLSFSTQIALLGGVGIALIYSIPARFAFAPKRIGWLKPVLVAAVWTWVGPGMMLAENGQWITAQLLLTLSYFVWIVCLSLVFEWRDRKHDNQAFAANLWRKKSLSQLVITLILLHAVTFIFILFFSNLNLIFTAISFSMSLGISVWAAWRERELIYLFWVDGLLLWVPAVLWLGQRFG
ncbi:MAG: hypothetical protein C0424_09530 [Sphingobacteriaceae bacterium]|nr:hypothetical protein [Sphingobacteriaceae bacterium]